MVNWCRQAYCELLLFFLPKSPHGYILYGLWLEKQGRLAEAIGLLNRAVSQKKIRSFSLLNNLGYYALCLAKQVEVNQQYLDLADQCLSAAHQMEPENRALLGNSADYLMYCQQYASAIEILSELLAQDPQDPEVVFKLAMAYAFADRLEEAQDCFLEALRQANSSLRLKCLLGYRWFLYFKLKRYRGEAEEVENSLGKYPDAEANRATAELIDDYPELPRAQKP